MKLSELKEHLDRMPTRLTKAGWWYVGATALTSAAAYHSASNVLFLALAFMMSALLLNGLISWWNFSQLETRHLKLGRLRAGESGIIHFDLLDHKQVMRSQGLSGVVLVQSKMEKKPTRLKTFLHNPHHPSGRTTASVEWTPTHRGWHKVQLRHIESYFPFGLLLKVFKQELATETLVWPALDTSINLNPKFDVSDSNPTNETQKESTRPFTDSNTEISGLRNYSRGDPIHSFHWKKNGTVPTSDRDRSTSDSFPTSSTHPL